MKKQQAASKATVAAAEQWAEEVAESAGVPCQGVTGDTVYGSDWQMRAWLEKRGLSYVLAVPSTYQIFYEGRRQWVSEVESAVLGEAWRRLSAGAGAKGERFYDWALLPSGPVAERRQRWLLARRSRTGSLRGAELGGLVSAYHAVTAGACLPDRHALTRHNTGRSRTKKEEGLTREEAKAAKLLPLTVPEVRRLVWWLVWQTMPNPGTGCELVALATEASGACKEGTLQADFAAASTTTTVVVEGAILNHLAEQISICLDVSQEFDGDVPNSRAIQSPERGAPAGYDRTKGLGACGLKPS